MQPFVLSKHVEGSFADALERATTALAAEGFGILTEIDVQATLQAKLGAAIRPYRILGACNAVLAQQALAAEPMIGALMPCNVIVQEHAGGAVEVGVMNPAVMVPVTGNVALQAVQDEVQARIERFLAAL